MADKETRAGGEKIGGEKGYKGGRAGDDGEWFAFG